MIVRAADWKQPLDGLPLRSWCSPIARGRRRQRASASRSSAAGFEEFSLHAAATARRPAPGSVEPVTDRARTTTRRADRLRPRCRCASSLPDTHARDARRFRTDVGRGLGEARELSVHASTLRTCSARRRRIVASKATLVLRPAFPRFADYPDYRFYDPQRAKEGYDEPLGDRSHRRQGQGRCSGSTSPSTRTATYQLQLPRARLRSRTAAATSPPQAHARWCHRNALPGRHQGDGRPRATSRAAPSAACNCSRSVRTAKQIAVAGLHAAMVETRYVSVLTKQDSGLYRYVSKERRYACADQPLD